MFKFDRMFKDAIESGTKTATFRDKQKAMPGEVHAGVWVHEFGLYRIPDFWMRIKRVIWRRLDCLSCKRFGFKTKQQMYDYAHLTYLLTPGDLVCVHEFEIIHDWKVRG